MKETGILSLVLAVVLVALSIGSMFGQGNVKQESNQNSTIMEESVYNNIMTRASVRKYQDKAVESEKIEKLLRAGMAAPSAVNKQPWHFIVVTDKQQLKNIAAIAPNAGMAAHAPLVIVVCGNMDKALPGEARGFWIQDASAATENILLAAHAMGLGAVWTGTYPSEQRCAAYAKLLNLPDNIVPLCSIVIGYPAETPKVKDKWKTENISYNTFGCKAGADVQIAPVSVPEKSFKEIDITKEFRENGFTFFHGNGTNGILLAAGDRTASNAMTIGWGAIGTLWQQDMVSVYVAEKRYTKGFLDKGKYFTIMTFPKEYGHVLDYMGSHSGRDGDKAKALGLHTLYTENGTPYYEEADMVIECEIMYAAPFDKAAFKEAPTKFYSKSTSGVHSQYVGKVVKAMKKQ